MNNLLKTYLVVTLGISYCQTLEKTPWEAFKRYHGKVYSSIEVEESSRIIFEKNAADVVAHNLAFKEGKVSYYKELNSFADMEPLEFQTRNGFRAGNLTQIVGTLYLFQEIKDTKPPKTFDWRDKKVVSPMKDQGQCGSCWAFSATGAMESQIMIASGGENGPLLSEQQLVECDKVDHGCKNGNFISAWDYVIKNGGIASESEYPYTAGKGKQASCHYEHSMARAVVQNYEVFQNKDEEFIKETLVRVGPLSIGIDATDMQLLSGGIYSCPAQISLNHAVLLVGYGRDGTNGEDYWIVKNSWGTHWGDEGYFLLTRRRDADCGMTQFVAYPKAAIKGVDEPGVWDRLMDWKFSINFENIKVTSLLLLVTLVLLVAVLIYLNRVVKSGYLRRNFEADPLLPKSKYESI